MMCFLDCLTIGICGEGMKTDSAIKAGKNSVQMEIKQSMSAIKANTHGQRPTAMKAESRT